MRRKQQSSLGRHNCFIHNHDYTRTLTHYTLSMNVHIISHSTYLHHPHPPDSSAEFSSTFPKHYTKSQNVQPISSIERQINLLWGFSTAPKKHPPIILLAILRLLSHFHPTKSLHCLPHPTLSPKSQKCSHYLAING